MFLISKGFHIDLKANFPFPINQNTNTKNQTLIDNSFRELGWDRCDQTAEYMFSNLKKIVTKILSQIDRQTDGWIDGWMNGGSYA